MDNIGNVSFRITAYTANFLWDGRTNTGQPLASGVYLYRLETGQHTQTRKLVLVQ